MKFISLFAGIGGFDLGFERAGMQCVAQVEIDPFCQKVLAKHWPNVPKYGDIRDVGKHNLPDAEVICGGFPCQPYSSSGAKRGSDDDRALWPEMLRVISELKPSWVVSENVARFEHMGLDTLFVDMESIGYESTALEIPIGALKAPHSRKRWFMVSYTEGNGYWEGGEKFDFCKTDGRQDRTMLPESTITNWWKTEPRVDRVAYGVPSQVDRLRCLGNAVAPQIPEIIARSIMQIVNTPNKALSGHLQELSDV